MSKNEAIGRAIFEALNSKPIATVENVQLLANEVLRLQEELKASFERHNLIQDAQAESIESGNTGIMRATVAAVMEAIADDMAADNFLKPGEQPYVIVDLDKQRTIWDRYELHGEPVTADGADTDQIKFTLTKK